MDNNYKKAVELSENPAVYSDIISKEETKIRLQRYNAAMLMAEWKDSQPQIIEIFGKRVKIVEDEGHTIAFCKDCAFDYFCKYKLGRGRLCETSNHNLNRHFVEVDEEGNEI